MKNHHYFVARCAFALSLLVAFSIIVFAQTSGAKPQKPIATAPPPPPAMTRQAEKTLPVVTSLAAPKVSRSVAVGGWQHYAFDDAHFSISLPVKPKVESESAKIYGDEPTITHAVSSDADEGVYMVVCLMNMPYIAEKLSEKYRKEFFDGAMQGFIRGMLKEIETNGIKLKLTPGEQHPVNLAGRDGREQKFTYGPLNCTARAVMVSDRLYIVISMLNDEAKEADSDAFFASFNLHMK